MANKNLFRSNRSSVPVPVADTTNNAGGKAYSMSDKEALAQMAVTGTFNNTYYVSGEDQLKLVQEIVGRMTDVRFLAKLAVYARQKGFMKDMPAFLVAALASRTDSGIYFDRAFSKVIDNGKMLQNFVQIMRSGTVGRNSLGSKAKRLVKGWFEQDPEWIFRQSIGSDPSLADILKLAHPHPKTKQHEALFSYLIGKKKNARNLPKLVKQYEKFKEDPKNAEVPNVPFQFLASLDIPDSVWKSIAQNAGWHMARMNLNTFQRHGVFANDEKMVNYIANLLRDQDQIRRSKVFPYQLMTAYMFANAEVPSKIKNALQDAMEIATENVPSFGDNVFVFPDVSGSMGSPVTGHRPGATSVIRCIDVAALVASTILRTSENAEVIPFENDCVDIDLNPRDSVMTNAKRLASVGGGGTNCSAPLQYILKMDKKVDLVVYISDNESWVDSSGWRHNATRVSEVWSKIKRNNPKAKMVCIDITPNHTVQAKNDASVLNIGGFSDQIFEVIDAFVHGDSREWVKVIENTEI